MLLYCNSGASLMLPAFDCGEGESEEQYPGDTLYTVLSGSCTLSGDASLHGALCFLEKARYIFPGY